MLKNHGIHFVFIHHSLLFSTKLSHYIARGVGDLGKLRGEERERERTWPGGVVGGGREREREGARKIVVVINCHDGTRTVLGKIT